MKKYKKIFVFLMVSALLFAVAPQKTEAEEYNSEKNGLDVIFVMDYSGSMKTNDPEHIAQGMVKAFIDSVHSADIRVGFVSYNDRLLSTTSPLPVNTNEEREMLKRLIDASEYSGNTDIGLGLFHAYELVGQDQGRKKAIVLISDGESDLKGSVTGRILENSIQDVSYVVEKCEEQSIPIYTIAFGKYDGNTAALEEISRRTAAQTYTVEKPENLIEILYGIFASNMDYSIQEITDSIYAPGIQNIRFKLDEAYLDELDVLMISPQSVGPVRVLYGEQQLEAVNLKNYAVAKITDINSEIKELTVQTETIKNQELQIYLISYRNLTPVLKIEPSIGKNVPLTYQVYFKDKNGTVIADEAFYKNFTCSLALSQNEAQEEALDTGIQGGIMEGQVVFNKSGNYYIGGRLDDSMGTAVFKPVQIEVSNSQPTGSLPQNERYTVLTKNKQYVLNDYFSDPDGDVLSYSLKDAQEGFVKARITDETLYLTPVKPGSQALTILVSDGEGTEEYSYYLTVTPLWKAYWWVILFACVALAGILWKVFHKPKPVLEQITEEKKRNRFCGKLDVYFTGQPESDNEIPPLSFQMHKVKDNNITLGNLMKDYPEACDALGLDEIHLIADTDRRMILYHTSKAMVMIGNSIVCRQIQYKKPGRHCYFRLPIRV